MTEREELFKRLESLLAVQREADGELAAQQAREQEENRAVLEAIATLRAQVEAAELELFSLEQQLEERRGIVRRAR